MHGSTTDAEVHVFLDLARRVTSSYQALAKLLESGGRRPMTAWFSGWKPMCQESYVLRIRICSQAVILCHSLLLRAPCQSMLFRQTSRHEPRLARRMLPTCCKQPCKRRRPVQAPMCSVLWLIHGASRLFGLIFGGSVFRFLRATDGGSKWQLYGVRQAASLIQAQELIYQPDPQSGTRHNTAQEARNSRRLIRSSCAGVRLRGYRAHLDVQAASASSKHQGNQKTRSSAGIALHN